MALDRKGVGGLIMDIYTPSGGSTPAAQATAQLRQALNQLTSMPSADLANQAYSVMLNQPQVEQQAEQDLTQQSGIPQLQTGQQDLGKIFQMYLADQGLAQRYTNTNDTNPYTSPILAAGMDNGQIGGNVTSAPNPYLNATPEQILASTQPSAGSFTPDINTKAMMAVPNATTDLLDMLQTAVTGQQGLVKGKMADVSKNYQAQMGVLQSMIDAATKKEENAAKTATQVVDVNGKKILINSLTGEIIKEFGSDADVSEYQKERAKRTIQSVDELMGQVNNFTVGFGSLLAGIPTTKAKNFKSQLDTLKSNISFGELTAMREASKTGGALGQVSNIEEQMLQSSLGGLDAAQNPADFKQQLQKVKDSITRWNEANGISTSSTTSGAGNITKGDGTVWQKNTDGSYTRIK